MRFFYKGSKKNQGPKAYDTVLSETINLIKKEFGTANKIDEQTSLTKDLDLDSVDVMELIEAFEDKFHVEIPIDSLPKLKTVEDLVRLIHPLVQKNIISNTRN